MANDLDKLLGGYATGTLTEEERKALFEAALDDQQLFNALADEEALKDLLDDPESRKRLLAVLTAGSLTTNRSWLAAIFEWFRRPVNLTLAGSAAVAAVALFVFVNLLREEPHQPAVPPVSELLRPSTQDAGSSGRARGKPRVPESLEVAPSAIDLGSSPGPPATASGGSGRAAISKASGADTRQAPTDQAPAQRFRLSVGSPSQPGPARHFFYALSERQRQPKAPASAAAPRRGAQRRNQIVAEKSVPDSSGIGQLSSVEAPTRIGLKLGFQKRNADGVFSATKFGASFGPDDNLRLTAEANTDGYLHVLQAVDGSWRRLFPPTRDSGGGPAPASIRAGQQIRIPLLGSARSARDPDQNKLFVILSRNEIRELAGSSTRTPRDVSLGRSIEGLLDRWRSTTQSPLIIGTEQSDKAIYFVPNAPLQTAPLVIELDIAPL